MPGGPLRALLLDFDGLLYDTESSAFAAWQELYARHGAELSLRRWVAEVVGRPPGASQFDPIVELERITGVPLDRVTLLAQRDARRAAMLPHHLMAGADALLADARVRRLRTAIVTSNSLVNVRGHLARAGCTHSFDAIVCADGDPARGKPRPTLYLEALNRLGLGAGEAVALEDSPNGVAAAKAAGLYCIAVPNPLTRGAAGLELADRTVGSLAELESADLLPTGPGVASRAGVWSPAGSPSAGGSSSPGGTPSAGGSRPPAGSTPSAGGSRPPAGSSSHASIAERLRRFAGVLERSGRSPLYVALIAGAADDADAGGVVARLFAHDDARPGSVPALRLMAALHELAQSGREPALSAFYPSAGGTSEPVNAWPTVRAVLEDDFAWVQARLHRTVQTNEPGRSAVLYSVLLWLTARHRRPIRLLEIGASAGLNLICDRYRYDAGGLTLGDPTSPVRFDQPWRPGPPVDLAAAAAQLRIAHREGCDPNPLDPSNPDDRRRLVSYIWPDEPKRLARLQAALTVAAPQPPMVVKSEAIDWLPGALARRRDDELTVVWHSLVTQYVEPSQWQAILKVVAAARDPAPDRRIVWVGMEPSESDVFAVTAGGSASEPETRLAECGDHGPPVRWGRRTG